MKKFAMIMTSIMMAVSMVGCGGSTSTSTKSNEPDQNVSAEVAAEATKQEQTDPETKDLVIYCPHPLEFIEPLVSEFETQTGVSVEVVAAGTGELLKRVESEQGNPLGDIFWGGSLSTMKPQQDLFENYQSANEEYVYDNMKNVEGPLTRFTNIPSVIMVNTDLIGDIKIEGYEDLLNPELKWKIAHCDPYKY